MSTTNVYHKSRKVIYEQNWPATNENAVSVTIDSDGEIYMDETTNIAAYTIDGGSPSIPLTVSKGQILSISITKINSANTAQLILTQRRKVDLTIIKNSAETLAESAQGTKQYFLHRGDGIVSIVDSSLINDTNYLGGTSWTTNPIIATVSLPIITGVFWTSMFWDYLQDRMILVGRDTSTTTQFHLCALHVSGTKEDEIWNLAGDTQNSYDTFVSDTILLDIYPMVDFVNDIIVLRSNRFYVSDLSSIGTSWGYDIAALYNFSVEQTKKDRFYPELEMYTGYNFHQKFSNPDRFLRYGNYWLVNQTWGVATDALTGNTYKATDSVTNIFVFNNLSRIASINSTPYRSSIAVSASIKRRMIFTNMAVYSNHQQRVILLDLDSVTQIKSEAILNDTDVAGASDAEYINNIECFAVMSNGAAATQGKRLVYYVDANNNGVDSLLKYKVLLGYDCEYVATNRYRF